jgi:hypothetical protein
MSTSIISEKKIKFEVQKISRLIQDQQAKLKELERDLETLQQYCEHSGVEEYRGRLIGTCSTCLQGFLTKRQVDQIFEE